MVPVLTELNAIPGVVGSMVCSSEGTVLAQAFPAVFTPSALAQAARAVTDGAQAIGVGRRENDVLDLRFREVRLLARPCAGGVLAVLCNRTTNPQLLLLSTAAAAGKLAQVRGAAPEPAAAEALPSLPSHLLPPAEARHPSKSSVAAPASGLAELRRRLAAPLELEEATAPRSPEPTPPRRPPGRTTT